MRFTAILSNGKSNDAFYAGARLFRRNRSHGLKTPKLYLSGSTHSGKVYYYRYLSHNKTLFYYFSVWDTNVPSCTTPPITSSKCWRWLLAPNSRLVRLSRAFVISLPSAMQLRNLIWKYIWSTISWTMRMRSVLNKDIFYRANWMTYNLWIPIDVCMYG